MPVLSKCLIAGLLSAATFWGQTFHAAPSETDRKTPGSFAMDLESPQGKAPVALQWEYVVPPALTIQIADIKIGKAAESARKTLTCAMASKKASTRGETRYTCILAGGQEPIGNGPIAQVQYRAQADVEGAPIRVAIENVQGASADLKLMPMPNADVIVHIR